jgi:hypothetical protein
MGAGMQSLFFNGRDAAPVVLHNRSGTDTSGWQQKQTGGAQLDPAAFPFGNSTKVGGPLNGSTRKSNFSILS